MFDFVYEWNKKFFINEKIDFDKNKKFYENKDKELLQLEKIFNTIKNNLKSAEINKSNDISNSLSTFFTLEENNAKELYRPQDQDFEKKHDIIFSGCSQTHGHYISQPLVKNGNYKNIWGFLVAEHFNKSSINLAMPAQSIYLIVKGIINQISKYGKPEIVLVCFPDFGRFSMPYSQIINPQRAINKRNGKLSYINNTVIEFDNHPTFSKIPHKAEDVLDLTIPLFYNLQSILFLEKYCKTNNIYLKYSSWHTATSALLSLLKENTGDYHNYIDVDNFMFWSDGLTHVRENLFKDCHKEFENEYYNIFNMGRDGSHMGIHRHLHIAEGFIKEIENDRPWEK